MASIDKIYVSTYKDYKEFINFCKLKQSEIQSIFNVDIFDYLYNDDLDEEAFFSDDEEYAITNFPYKLDYYFIKYCDIPFVVERLQEQYSESEYNDVKNSDTILQNYTYEKYKSFKVFHKHKGYHHIINTQKIREYMITINDPNNDVWCYNKYQKNWINTSKSNNLNYGYSILFFGYSIKAVIRKVKHWNLPKGLQIQVKSPYKSGDVIIITK